MNSGTHNIYIVEFLFMYGALVAISCRQTFICRSTLFTHFVRSINCFEAVSTRARTTSDVVTKSSCREVCRTLVIYV
jgi:hypothetical protein